MPTDPDRLTAFRRWAEAMAPNFPHAVTGLQLLAELDGLRTWVASLVIERDDFQAEVERLRGLNLALAERVAAQSELLSRRAEGDQPRG
jgi:hypothetical protein